MINDQNIVRGRHLDSLAADAKRFTLEQNLALNQAVQAELEEISSSNGGLSAGVIDNVNEFFTPTPELQDRYAVAPFDSANVVGLDLSHLIDGVNFELDTENLTDGQVTRIRSGSASYNVDNGISRGYVKVSTACKCTLTVKYSVSSQNSDYGGCIVTQNTPNTTFTLSNLSSANFFKRSGNNANQTATYTLEKNKVYYLNFGYAKNATTNSNDDRFYIHEIRVSPEVRANSRAEYFFGIASDIENVVIAKVGGKFIPTVKSMPRLIAQQSDFDLLDNRIRRLFSWWGNEYSDYCLGEPSDYRANSVKVKVKFQRGLDWQNWWESGDPAPLLTCEMNGVTQSVELVMPPATSPEDILWQVAPIKLTDASGFITYHEGYTDGEGTYYSHSYSVQPFAISETGAPLLGNRIDLRATQRLCSQMSLIYSAVHDPSHVFFSWEEQTEFGNETKYATIIFNGTNATVVTPATTVGVDYSDKAGKVCLTAFFPSCLWPDTSIGETAAGDITLSSHYYYYDISFKFDTMTPLPVWSYELKTYDDNQAVTRTQKFALIHHGLYQSSPITYKYFDSADGTDLPWIDYKKVIGVFKAKAFSSDPTEFFVLCLEPGTYSRTDKWWNSVIKVFSLHTSPPSYYLTDKTFDDIYPNIEF